jgi:RNA polymerase sigma-54 factor
MLKQQLQQILLQKLSPQQIQMIKLLEIPTFRSNKGSRRNWRRTLALEEGSEDDEDVAGMEADERNSTRITTRIRRNSLSTTI